MFGIAARVVPPAAVAPVAARVAVAASVTAPIAVAAAGIAIPVPPLCVGDTLQTQKGATGGYNRNCQRNDAASKNAGNAHINLRFKTALPLFVRPESLAPRGGQEAGIPA